MASGKADGSAAETAINVEPNELNEITISKKLKDSHNLRDKKLRGDKAQDWAKHMNEFEAMLGVDAHFMLPFLFVDELPHQPRCAAARACVRAALNVCVSAAPCFVRSDCALPRERRVPLLGAADHLLRRARRLSRQDV